MLTLTRSKIDWRHDIEEAKDEAKHANSMVFIEVYSPECFSCQNMEKRTWSDHQVAKTLADQFVPVQINILEHDEAAKPPLLATWTPTLIAMCPNGNVHRKWQGFLPPKQFLGELALARVNYAMARQAYDEAHKRAQEAVELTQGDLVRHSEALYWQAVAAYKASGNQDLLVAGWKDLLTRFPDSEWAKRVDFAAEL